MNGQKNNANLRENLRAQGASPDELEYFIKMEEAKMRNKRGKTEKAISGGKMRVKSQNE